MKKRLFWFVTLLLVVMVVSSCATPTPTTAPETQAPAAAEESGPSFADYTAPEPAYNPVPLASGAQASCQTVAYTAGDPVRIAYMPPATEFNYYMAIGEGIKAKAAEMNAETFMLAPQSGSDIEGQMGMIQDVLTQDVNAIILSTHDENAAAPLVKQAVDKGIAVIIVNSDIANFPTAVHGVVGYSQRRGTFKEGMYVLGMVDSQAKVGVLEGLPGYHSTERIGGYLDAFEPFPDMEIVASLPTEWNVETGNSAMTDLLQAHPEVQVVVTANDYIAIGAAKAAEALSRNDVLIFGNDGDTTGLEDIAAGRWTATVNTTPFVMGQVVLEVAMDCLNGEYPGGWTETPTVIVDETNAQAYLCQEDKLYPKPSKTYPCP
ncbi:MAG: sugar ABC transporter substrate-binding protein [Anaerolineales bacterium]|jgi:ribose transport system substrate-binding protein